MGKIHTAWNRLKFVALFSCGWAALQFCGILLGVYTTVPTWWISPVIVISVGIHIKIQQEKISDLEKALTKAPSP